MKQLQSSIPSRLLYLLHRHLVAIHSFRGYMEQMIFDSSILIMNSYFFGRATLRSLFISRLSLQPSILSSTVSVSFTKRVTFIYTLKDAAFILTVDLAFIHCLKNTSAMVCLFPKNAGSSDTLFQRYCDYFYRKLGDIYSVNGTVYFLTLKLISIHFCLHFISAYF